MARRKNVKRIDPRYFLHETVDRDIDTGEALEEETGRLDRADEPPGGWTTSRGPRKSALGDPVPGGEGAKEKKVPRDTLATQWDATEEQEAWRDSIEEGVPPLQEDEGPQRALSQWAEMFPEAATALETVGATLNDLLQALTKDSYDPEMGLDTRGDVERPSSPQSTDQTSQGRPPGFPHKFEE